MSPLSAHIDGVALWAPTLPGWDHARTVLRDEAPPADAPHPVPSPTQLPRAERRRASLTTALSLVAADEAVRACGHDARSLLAVFTSTHGDLPVIDSLCNTLVHRPTQVSPTRFLHSIHNAAAGHWSVLTGNGLANTATSGAEYSFAHGLLESLVQCAAEQQPVLFVAYDTAAVGALTHTVASAGVFAAALVIAPRPGPQSSAQLRWHLTPGGAPQPQPHSQAAQGIAHNAMAAALPLFEALALARPARLAWPLSRHQSLRLEIGA